MILMVYSIQLSSNSKIINKTSDQGTKSTKKTLIFSKHLKYSSFIILVAKSFFDLVLGTQNGL